MRSSRDMGERFAKLIVTVVLAVCTFVAHDGSTRGAPPGRSARQALHATPAPAGATAALGLDLMRRLGAGNIVFSPDSIATALAMAGTGAAGETARQIASALHLGSPAAFASMGALQRRMAQEQASAAHGEAEAPMLDLANALFLQRGFLVEPAFFHGLRRNFGVEPVRVDFAHDSSGAARRVNDWVSRRTHGVIRRAVDSFDPSTALALANAVYLEATWAERFDERATGPEAFYGRSGARRVPFMHQTTDFKWGSGPGYTALDMPYAASTFSLTILLPSREGVGVLLGNLTQKRLDSIFRRMSTRRIHVSLPRFHLAFNVNLIPTLTSLGIRDAFDARVADFSRIARARLAIDKVAHAADLAVDEHGTVAAASTVSGISLTSAPREQPTPFNANRPFLFFLRDDRSGAVLFAGRLSDPST